MHLQLSSELNDIVTYAKEEAIRLGSYTITTDHIILGIIRHGENPATAVLHKAGMNLVEFKKKIEEEIRKNEVIPIENANRIILSKASENALKVMYLEARATSRQYQPDAGHLLLAILRGQDWSCALGMMEKYNITYSAVRKLLAEISDNPHNIQELENTQNTDGKAQDNTNRENTAGGENNIGGKTEGSTQKPSGNTGH